jgi:hypothetical protein
MSDISDINKDIDILTLLPDLKKELGEDCIGVDDEQLLKFLYWKPNIERASKRYRDFLSWKTANPGIFDDTLRVSKDPELERCLLSEVLVSPPLLLTKQGGPILIGRLRNNDMTDGRTCDGVCRMIFYKIDAIVNRPETQSHGVTIIHDLTGFNKSKNFKLEVAKKLFHGLFGQFPVHIAAVYVCKAPSLVRAFFKLISNIVMTKKVRERIHFIDDFSGLSDVIDEDSLLVELGGTLEWNTKDWIEEQKKKELDGSMKSLTDIDPKKSAPASAATAMDVS